MSGHPGGKLYSPELLGLATQLAAYPLEECHNPVVSERSSVCGSHVELGVKQSDDGAIASVGMQVSACAVGQASAAIMAGDIAGRSAGDVRRARDALASWLARDGDLPQWRGIEALDPARDYTGRHGALMLSWNAACKALSLDARAS